MSRPVVLRVEASQDVEDARDYYNTRQAGLGQVFLNRLNEVVARIGDMPEQYGRAWQQVRAVRIRRFPYVAYYQILDAHIEVLAVMHGSRDQSAWQSRV